MQIISKKALVLKSAWLQEDQRFFSKYHKDIKAMQIINALAEMIVTYDSQQREIQFSC